MNRNTLFALVAFIVLGISAFTVLRAPEKGERTGPRKGPAGVAEMKADFIDELEVTSGKEKTTLKKEGGSWRVTAPVAYPADAEAMKQAIEKLGKVTWGDIVSEQKEKAKEMEVDDEKGVRLVVKQAGKVLADLYLGKAAGGQTLVRPAGSDQIWQASELQKWTFAKDTKGWRSKIITDFKRDEIESISVEAAGKGKTVFKRIAPDKEKNTQEKFEIIESAAKIEKLDEGVPQGITNAIGSLRATDFDDAAKPEETGLASPTYTLVAKAGGKDRTVLIGKAKGESFYVKTAEGAQTFLVPKYTVQNLAKAPIEFRDKTLTDLKADEVVGIDITYAGSTIELLKEGAEWKAKKGGPSPLDVSRVPLLAGAFAGWKANGFAESTDPRKTGLGKPTGKVTVHGKDGKSATLLFGTLDGEDYPVQVVGRPEVYRVKKNMAERVLKKADDFKKAEPTAKR